MNIVSNVRKTDVAKLSWRRTHSRFTSGFTQKSNLSNVLKVDVRKLSTLAIVYERIFDCTTEKHSTAATAQSFSPLWVISRSISERILRRDLTSECQRHISCLRNSQETESHCSNEFAISEKSLQTHLLLNKEKDCETTSVRNSALNDESKVFDNNTWLSKTVYDLSLKINLAKHLIDDTTMKRDLFAFAGIKLDLVLFRVGFCQDLVN